MTHSLKKKRAICVITGTRSEYGLLKPILSAIQEHPRLGLRLIVAGMHLSSEFGRTIDVIRSDGFSPEALVPMNPPKDDARSMALAIGRGILGLSRAIHKIQPDITLVLGDRIEALAGALASAYLNIPVAHVHGGDITKGGLDESARHAITKLAHIHFTATRASRGRVLKMGERPEHVFLTGAPGIDGILGEKLPERERLDEEYGIPARKPFLLVLQHSVTTEPQKAALQFHETLRAVLKARLHLAIIYPNSDAGGRAIIREIEKLRGRRSVSIFKSLPRNVFLSLMKHAAVMVGNSSSGIIESSVFKTPVVNIGMRQFGRERASNVLDVSHKSAAIHRAIQKAMHGPAFRQEVQHCENPYGDGHASIRIVQVLSSIRLGPDLLQKHLAYLVK